MLALALWMWTRATRKWKRWQRATYTAALLLIFLDMGYLVYVNSFYAEPTGRGYFLLALGSLMNLWVADGGTQAASDPASAREGSKAPSTPSTPFDPFDPFRAASLGQAPSTSFTGSPSTSSGQGPHQAEAALALQLLLHFIFAALVCRQQSPERCG